MKKLLFVFLFILTFVCIYSNTIILKENFYTNEKAINLSDLIKETDINNLPEISFNLKKLPCKIYSSEITKSILNNGNYDFIIIGDYTVIYGKSDKEDDNTTINKSQDPIQFLEDYIGNFFDIKNSKIKVNILKTNPEIDLSKIHDNYKWQVEHIKSGLKDLLNLKKISIKIYDNNYDVFLKINMFANFYIAKENFLKDDFLKTDGFSIKNTDVTVFSDIDNIIFDISKFNNTQFAQNISTGEILRTNHIKMVPLVKKGESIKYVFNKNNIEITSYCVLLQDAFENEKIKFKLNNGNEKFGILRNKSGSLYVEIL